MIIIPAILLVAGVCMAVVAGLAWSAKLPGNNVVGIRAPEARMSQENWEITHRVAGPPWAVAALAMIGAAALAFLAIRPESSGWMWLWVAVALLASLGMLGVGGAMGAHTIALYDAKKTQDANASGGGCGCGSGGCGAEVEDSCDSGSAGCASTSNSVSDPAADCGVAGGCGSCGLDGMCEGGSAAPRAGAPVVDREALRRAAGKQSN